MAFYFPNALLKLNGVYTLSVPIQRFFKTSANFFAKSLLVEANTLSGFSSFLYLSSRKYYTKC